MTDETGLSAGDFGTAFKGFLEQAVSQAPTPEPFFRQKLSDLFGELPTRLPIVSEQFAPHEHVNLQLALDAYLAEPQRSSEVLGVARR